MTALTGCPVLPREHPARFDRCSSHSGAAERGVQRSWPDSPCLANACCSAQLEKHMRRDSLNEKIAHRPSPETLIKEGVLHEDPRSPEDKYAEAIEEEYAKREGGA